MQSAYLDYIIITPREIIYLTLLKLINQFNYELCKKIYNAWIARECGKVNKPTANAAVVNFDLRSLTI